MADEMRLIDANAIPYEEHYVPDGDIQWEYKKELCVLKPTIDALSTVDAVEVVHAEWDVIEDDYHFDTIYKCSACKEEFVTIDGTPAENLWNYCPNCGAKMDGGNEDV